MSYCRNTQSSNDTPLGVFHRELCSLLNKCGWDTQLNTPDFIIAQFILSCLYAYKGCKEHNDEWHGISEEKEKKGD